MESKTGVLLSRLYSIKIDLHFETWHRLVLHSTHCLVSREPSILTARIHCGIPVRKRLIKILVFSIQMVPKGTKSEKEFNFFSSVKGYFIGENSTKKKCPIWKHKQVSNLRITFERKRYQKTQLSYLNVIFSKLFNSVLLCVADCSVLNRSEHCRGNIYIIRLKINRSTYRKENSTISVETRKTMNPAWMSYLIYRDPL